MNIYYNKYKNLNFLLNNKGILIFYNFQNINAQLINIIKKKFFIRIIYLNKKIFNLFNIKSKQSLIVILINNNYDLLKNIIIFIKNLLKKNPLYIINKNLSINKIPLKEISQLSKENLIFEFIKIFKLKIAKLIFILKLYEKYISK